MDQRHADYIEHVIRAAGWCRCEQCVEYRRAPAAALASAADDELEQLQINLVRLAAFRAAARAHGFFL